MFRCSSKLRFGLVGITLLAGMSCASSSSSPDSLGGADAPGGSAGASTNQGGSATGGSTSGGTSTGGSTSTGGTTSTGGSSTGGAGGAGGAGGMPPHIVGKCDNVAPAGTLENITPAALDIATWCWPGAKECTADQIGTYGAHGLAIDPTDSGTLYLGTDRLGIWKTADCGSNWVKIDTGTHQKELDSGRNWTIVIDPLDSRVIYTTPGYGAEGFYKSTDGGVNWDSMFPQNIQSSLPYGGFIETISLDPSDHRHLLVTFHGPCSHSPTDGGDWQCMAESLDSATTWRVISSPIGWSEGFGQTMIDSKTWFLSDGSGIYRTTDGGANWTKVHDKGASGHIFLAPDNTFFTGGYDMRQSKNGITWNEIPGSPAVYSVNGSNAIVSDGTRLYTSTGQYGGGEPKVGYYSFALLSDPSKWTPVFGSNHPLMQAGGSTLVYDPDHHLLYSTNLTAGIWRGVVPQ